MSRFCMSVCLALAVCLAVFAAPASASTSSSDLQAEELAVLTELYHTLDGPNWKIYGVYPSFPWFSPDTPTYCHWEGIKCANANDTIIHIELVKRHLKGHIPEILCKLTSLEHLALAGNQLTGTIPVSYGALTRLRYFDLSGNQLTGMIPNSLANCPDMKHFDVCNNQLQSPLPFMAFRHWSNLTMFQISNNLFAESIEPFWDLKFPHLQYFDVANNQFYGRVTDAVIENWDHFAVHDGGRPTDLQHRYDVFYIRENRLKGRYTLKACKFLFRFCDGSYKPGNDIDCAYHEIQPVDIVMAPCELKED